MKNQTYRMTMLYDFYGELLTERQREFFDFYYNDDLSLSEIAENAGISRQGVRDSVKRAEVQLTELEEHLGVAARYRRQAAALTAILSCADTLRTYNNEHASDPTIAEEIDRITALASSLIER